MLPKYHVDAQEPQLISGMKPGESSFGLEEASKAGRAVQLNDSPRIDLVGLIIITRSTYGREGRKSPSVSPGERPTANI